PAALILENLGFSLARTGREARPSARTSRDAVRRVERDSADADDTMSVAVKVEQPAAAALLVRRDAYEDVGGFDEKFYPAWYEDVDFCERFKTKGWDVYFAPNVKFHHEGGYSAKTMGMQTFLRSYYGNQLRYARKHFGVLGHAAVWLSVAVGMLGRM